MPILRRNRPPTLLAIKAAGLGHWRPLFGRVENEDRATGVVHHDRAQAQQAELGMAGQTSVSGVNGLWIDLFPTNITPNRRPRCLTGQYVEGSRTTDAGHADSALFDLLEVQQVGADDRSGDTAI